ncbi:hypothetical protein SAMD00019534_109360 [Acytostelium subglobosum LB1]|uniref:hypothetical protein n=1 Tax=Acytostelium subglobosum LB1 TaxID=1410327 RepID=UPI0006450BC0|nr:hypothetical protein SAMD00019534_109360 [Acytostelium subglobosum LB1]GAM27760.1 hypothetical protein SAMD00019534_109360 [Acytostelium subglobosum LB1]|eukprot:XP_012749419.1 hypothetical protein SAMD00019534_109360 [Acytostelium subglobosum LB1]
MISSYNYSMIKLRSMLTTTILMVLLLASQAPQQTHSFILTFPPRSTIDQSWLFRSTQYPPGTYDSPPGNGESYAKFDGKFSLETTPTSPELVATADLVFYHTSDFARIGYHNSNGDVDYCCTKALIEQKVCSKLDTLIINSTSTVQSLNETSVNQSIIVDSTIKYINIQFNALTQDTPVQVPIRYEVTKEGVYYLLVLSCDLLSQRNYTNLFITGTTTFMNPYGYLSGEKFPDLYFYLIMSLVYTVVAVFWLVLCWRYRKTLLPLQYWIAAVIALGFLEMLTNYAAFSDTNKTGQFNKASVFFMSFFSTMKDASSRLIVLIVSMGYGIILPVFPRMTKYKIGALTITYIVFSVSLYYEWLVPQPTSSDRSFTRILVVPVAVLDTIYYWWTCISLLSILSGLALKRQEAKLNTYKYFFYVLAISALITTILIIANLIVHYTKSYDETWKTNWIWDGFWDVNYMVVLCSIIWIWRPSELNPRLGYNELDINDDEDGTVEMAEGGVSRRLNVNRENDNGEIIGSPKNEHNAHQQQQKEQKEQALSEADEFEQFKRDITKVIEL